MDHSHLHAPLGPRRHLTAPKPTRKTEKARAA